MGIPHRPAPPGFSYRPQYGHSVPAAAAALDYRQHGAALDLTRDCQAAYLAAGPYLRRLFNQAFFTQLLICEEGLRGELAEPFDVLLAAAGPKNQDALVRTAVKENRKLSPEEVVQLADAYMAGASQKALAKRFGIHKQTVYRHLTKRGVVLRPVKVLGEAREQRIAQLYVEEGMTIAEIASYLGVGLTTVYNVLVRRNVKRRPRGKRMR